MRSFLLVLVLLLSGCGVTDSKPQPTATVWNPPNRETQPQPIVSRYGDCEDMEGSTPCVTYDEGQWRLVSSYDPYSFTALVQCSAEDYPKIMPCVWKHKSTVDGMWLVYTEE